MWYGSVGVDNRLSRLSRATTLSPPGRVKAVAQEGFRIAFSQATTVRVGTAETLHGFGTLPAAELRALELSLKLYRGTAITAETDHG